MKKKIRIVSLTICVLVNLFMGMDFSWAKECSDSFNPVYSSNSEALQWGFKFASAIPVKPHAVDRGNSQYEILNVYMDRGMLEQAAQLAGCIEGWRKCLGYADLGAYYAGKGREEKGRQYLEQARSCSESLTNWNASWQKDRVLFRIAEAQIMAGQNEKAEKTAADLPAEIAGMAGILRLSRLNGPDDYKNAVEKLQTMESSEYMEVKREVAKAYIGILRQLGREAAVEQCSFLQTRVYDVAEKLPLLIEQEMLCLLSHAAFAAGCKKQGGRILEYAEGKLKKGGLKARYDVKALAALAEIWHQEARDSQRAESLLTEAAELLMKSGVKGADRVSALISLARGYGKLKMDDKAWEFFRRSLQVAKLQQNARPRAMALTQICGALGRWGRPLPDQMSKELMHIYDALGAPW